MSDSSAKTRIGSKLGPYRLSSILGQGGMGTVFRGEDTFTGREVAVKLLHASFAKDPAVAQRFIREARAAVSLRHPNVVEVLHMNQDADGVVYMVLELLDGCSLDEHLRRQGPISLSEALEYLLPIMSALDGAHEKGIVHRDVKPENIFLSRTSTGVVPKLLDFGIAKMADAVTGFATNAGAIMGSPAYMSPEQAMGSNKIGPPTDVWAMGVVIYECLTGSSPFSADDAQKCLARVLTAEPPPLLQVAEGIVEEAALAIESTLKKESPERPSMRQLRLSLSSLLSVPPGAPEVSATRISGVDYTSLSGEPEGGFPRSPSAVGLAPTDPSVSARGTSVQRSSEGPPALGGASSAGETTPRVTSSESADGTLMPASSDPEPRRSSKGMKLAVVALLVAAAMLGFLIIAKMGGSNEGDLPAEEPLVAQGSPPLPAKPPRVEPEPEPLDEGDPNAITSSNAQALGPDLADAAVATAPKTATAPPTNSARAKTEARAAGSTKKSQGPTPSTEEILRKKREERIKKIPSISEL